MIAPGIGCRAAKNTRAVWVLAITIWRRTLCQEKQQVRSAWGKLNVRCAKVQRCCVVLSVSERGDVHRHSSSNAKPQPSSTHRLAAKPVPATPLRARHTMIYVHSTWHHPTDRIVRRTRVELARDQHRWRSVFSSQRLMVLGAGRPHLGRRLLRRGRRGFGHPASHMIGCHAGL